MDLGDTPLHSLRISCVHCFIEQMFLLLAPHLASIPGWPIRTVVLWHRELQKHERLLSTSRHCYCKRLRKVFFDHLSRCACVSNIGQLDYPLPWERTPRQDVIWHCMVHPVCFLEGGGPWQPAHRAQQKDAGSRSSKRSSSARPSGCLHPLQSRVSPSLLYSREEPHAWVKERERER